MMKNPFHLYCAVKSVARRVLPLIPVLFAASCSALVPVARSGDKIYRNVTYSTPPGRNLKMDLYVPQTGKPAPVVLWVFGGSWKMGLKTYHVNVRDLTQHGIAVAAIQYRLSGYAKYPAQLEDCRAAMNFLRANGQRFGLDPQRIGASGESAGGHLASLLGTVEGSNNIRAVFALYPPTDLVSMGKMYGSTDRESDVEKLLGGPIEQKMEQARQASPLYRANASSPPHYFIHGDQDTLVPLSQSQALHRKLREAGVESTLSVVPGAQHWFLLEPVQVSEVARFFKRHFAR